MLTLERGSTGDAIIVAAVKAGAESLAIYRVTVSAEPEWTQLAGFGTSFAEETSIDELGLLNIAALASQSEGILYVSELIPVMNEWDHLVMIAFRVRRLDMATRAVRTVVGRGSPPSEAPPADPEAPVKATDVIIQFPMDMEVRAPPVALNGAVLFWVSARDHRVMAVNIDETKDVDIGGLVLVMPLRTPQGGLPEGPVPRLPVLVLGGEDPEGGAEPGQEEASPMETHFPMPSGLSYDPFFGRHRILLTTTGDVREIYFPDKDGDGIGDALDNCPWLPNPEQEDTAGNGIGDACDWGTDSDNDGLFDAFEFWLGSDPADANSIARDGVTPDLEAWQSGRNAIHLRLEPRGKARDPAPALQPADRTGARFTLRWCLLAIAADRR